MGDYSIKVYLQKHGKVITEGRRKFYPIELRYYFGKKKTSISVNPRIFVNPSEVKNGILSCKNLSYQNQYEELINRIENIIDEIRSDGLPPDGKVVKDYLINWNWNKEN